MSLRYERLARASDRELEEHLRGGRPPDAPSVAGYEWRGYNTAPFTAVLGIRKFIKGFFAGPGGLEGYNIPVKQNGLNGPWLHRPHPEHPRRFGFYRVARVQADAKDSLYLNAVLLDYGASPRNFRLAPERVLRDYLVQPFQDDPDLLLGKAYVALGPCRVASNFFVLGRLAATDWSP
ncbi:MAG: hypothetical protein HY553_15460 [Elusimicrobia bacterium]|nr:hypothetical protein [Elusimicrobiota bacterium]